MRRRDLFTGGLAALSSFLVRPVFGQAKYPDHPIRLVVPFPPGGGYDAVGRPFADKMKSVLGSMVVENMGGGGSSLGAAAVARADARVGHGAREVRPGRTLPTDLQCVSSSASRANRRRPHRLTPRLPRRAESSTTTRLSESAARVARAPSVRDTRLVQGRC